MKLGTRPELLNEPDSNDAIWINVGRTNQGSSPSEWTESMFLTYGILKQHLGNHIGNSDLTITDSIRSLSLNGNDNSKRFRIGNQDGDNPVIFEVFGNRVTEINGSELISRFQGVTSSNNIVSTGDIGTPNQYSLKVHSRASSSSGVAAFKNYLGANIFDFRQSGGNPSLGLYLTSGIESIFLDGSNSIVRANQFRHKDSNFGIDGTITNIARYYTTASGIHRFTNNGNSINNVVLELRPSTGVVSMPNLPTSSMGLSSGDLWNNGGVINII